MNSADLPDPFTSPPEPLLPELEPYLEMDGSFLSLRHPYVYSIPHGDNFNAIVNRQFKAKKEAIADAREQRDWTSFLYLHERPYRRSAFDAILDQLDDTEYWSLLRGLWIDAEFVHQDFANWAELLDSDRPHRDALMTSDEAEQLSAMPETFEVYRGVADPSHIGLSWTIDAAKASWFAERWSTERPVVLKTSVSKDQVIAFLVARGESEVLIRPSTLDSLTVEEMP